MIRPSRGPRFGAANSLRVLSVRHNGSCGKLLGSPPGAPPLDGPADALQGAPPTTGRGHTPEAGRRSSVNRSAGRPTARGWGTRKRAVRVVKGSRCAASFLDKTLLLYKRGEVFLLPLLAESLDESMSPAPATLHPQAAPLRGRRLEWKNRKRSQPMTWTPRIRRETNGHQAPHFFAASGAANASMTRSSKHPAQRAAGSSLFIARTASPGGTRYERHLHPEVEVPEVGRMARVRRAAR